ncbi:MAG: hypothetical protein Q3988_05645 [Gemella sp.]|nr:hypothetical protein [Gemella sp.]
MIEKLEKLKIRYLNTEHSYWKQEDWIKKVHSIFTDMHYRKDMTLEEQYIFEAEYCLLTPNIRERYREKISLSDEELRVLISKRVKTAKENTKKTLKWYNNV